MIRLEVGYRPEFREQIQSFCRLMDIGISYRRKIGSGKHGDFYNIDGECNKIDMLSKFVEQLESDRNNKSFWFKLWN